MNDGKCDPAGRFLAGTMTLDRTPGASTLYQLDRNLRITPLLGGLALSNGLGWSPDGGTFYFIDTPTRRVDAFDYDIATGSLSNRRIFVDLQHTPGAPDGLSVDAEGCLWVAMARDGAAVRRFGPRGETREVIEIPTAKVTSCTFGGPELDELYITTACFGLDEFQLADQPLAGAVFRVRLNVKGLPPTRFLDVARRNPA
jgi:sugar lactone lactonase YvrE